jgi:hypothetical protein
MGKMGYSEMIFIIQGPESEFSLVLHAGRVIIQNCYYSLIFFIPVHKECASRDVCAEPYVELQVLIGYFCGNAVNFVVF